MNQSFLIFHIYFYFLPNDKIMSTGCKCLCFVLELPMCDQNIFSPHNINILLSSKQLLNENKDTNINHMKGDCLI